MGRETVLTWLRRYWSGVQALVQHPEPETVHSTRISLRRTRFGLWLFFGKETRDLRQALGRWNRRMSPIRDLDCLRARLESFPNSGQQAKIFHFLGRSREQRLRALRKALLAKRHERVLLRLLAFLERPSPVETTVAGILKRSQRRLKKVLSHLSPDSGPDELHRLRIACKRLRYACEFLEPAYPGTWSGLARNWRDFQDVLGQLQDVIVEIREMNDLLEKKWSPAEQAWLKDGLDRLERLRQQRYVRARRCLQQLPAVRKRFLAAVHRLGGAPLPT